MRRCILFISALMVSIFSFADDVNVIVNGGFETTLDSTWSVVVSGDAHATIDVFEEVPGWTTEAKRRLGIYVTAINGTPAFTDVYAVNNNPLTYAAGDSCYLEYYARTEVGGQQLRPMLISTDAVEGELTTLVFETRTLESANNGMKIVSASVSHPGTYQFAFACGTATGNYIIDNVILYRYSLLASAVSDAQEAYETAVISPLYGYSMDDYVSLKTLCDETNDFIADNEITKSVSDSIIILLESAVATFEASFIDEVVLKAYSEYGFTGDEFGVRCGYYNGDLDTLDNKMVSFKLEKGYMATFAQDVDGLGVSKVYIAQDAALELNLPAELQRSISFIRVSPWFSVGKKGSVGKKSWSDPENYNAEWYYNWGMGVPDQNSGFSTPEVQYVPMSWSKGDFWTGSEPVERVGKNMALNHHLAFNEPDNEGQSNLTVEAALEAYPKLLASGLRLGSPGVENVQYNPSSDSWADDGWIKQFMDSCVARGYRVDFIAAHDYIRRSTSQFIERFQVLHERYDIPVWVTEYNYGNPSIGSADLTEEIGYKNVTAMTLALEEADFIERYNWYYFFSGSTGYGGMMNDTLTSLGKFYRDLESPAPSYMQDVYEDGPYIPFTGFNASESIGSFDVYPNPTDGNSINLKYSASLATKATVSLIDISGKEVFTQDNSPQQIDVSSLQNGVYLLKVSNIVGVFTEKLLINK